LTLICLASYTIVMLSTFEVVAEPTRRKILDLLREGPLVVGHLVSALGLSQPAVSKHLRVLREAGLVEAEVSAQQRVYRLRAEPLREVEAWVAPYRRHWGPSLAALAHHLDTMGDDEAPRRRS